MRTNSPCEFITWEHFHALARQLALAIHDAGFEPEVMVAISRGGCIPARIVCDYLDVFNLDFVKVEHYHGTHKDKLARLRYPLSADISDRRVLLLDDVSDTGDSLKIAISHLLANGKPAELKTAVLHHKAVSRYTPDFYANIVEEWRWIIYPWAVMEDLRSMLRDMDSPPATAEDLASYIKQKHDLVVPRQSLEDVLSILINARESL